MKKKTTLSSPRVVFYRDWPKVLGFEVAVNTEMHNTDNTQDIEESVIVEFIL